MKSPQAIRTGALRHLGHSFWYLLASLIGSAACHHYLAPAREIPVSAFITGAAVALLLPFHWRNPTRATHLGLTFIHVAVVSVVLRRAGIEMTSRNPVFWQSLLAYVSFGFLGQSLLLFLRRRSLIPQLQALVQYETPKGHQA